MGRTPKIRFQGFTDDWEERKLGEVTVSIGERNKDNQFLEAYSITNEFGFIPQVEINDGFGYMKNVDRKAYKVVNTNSFAYNPARINIGSIGYYRGSKKVIVSSLYEVFQTKDMIYDDFLWQWLKSLEFQKWIERLQEGSVRLYFYYDKLSECEIRLPSVEEQQKIATYFSHLDSLIALRQRKVDDLKEMKKFCLKNMFPS